MTIWIEVENCDGCKKCERGCPYDCIEVIDGKASILDNCNSCGTCLNICKQKAIQSDIKPKEIPDFTDREGVWVFAEQRDGKLLNVSLELLSKAKELAEILNQKVSAVLLGYCVSNLSNQLIEYGAENVYMADDKILEHYRTIAYTNVIETLVKDYKPNIFLIGATHIGRDLAPRLSRRVGSGLTADCTELTIDPDEKVLLQTRPAFGGNVMATIANRYSRPQMATVRPGVMEAVKNPGNKGEVIEVSVSIKEEEIGTEVLDVVREKKAGKDITEAKIIVAGGRGVDGDKGFKLLHELADVIGGEVGGTRIVVEEGFVPFENQIGQTGKTVRPEIYIACGISGAIQHRAGIMNSRFIIAINDDVTSPIFKVANWGIVGDLHEVIPELIKQFKNSE